jgi:hypothetical protein
MIDFAIILFLRLVIKLSIVAILILTDTILDENHPPSKISSKQT